MQPVALVSAGAHGLLRSLLKQGNAAKVFMQMSRNSPVFILGCGRSGTTLAATILRQHPDLDIPEPESLYATYRAYIPLAGIEQHLSVNRWHKLLRLLVTDTGIKEWQHTPSFDDLADIDVPVRNFGAAYRLLYEYHARVAGRKLWGVKAISVVSHLEQVHRDFPDARFVCCIRDGRDVVLSLLENKFGPTNIISAASHWGRLMQQWENAREFIPEKQMYNLYYEDLIKDNDNATRRLLEFLDLPFDQQCVNFHQSEHAQNYSRYSHHVNLAKKPDLSRIGRSMHAFTHEQIESIEWVAGQQFTDLGYSLSCKEPRRPSDFEFMRARFTHTPRMLWNMITSDRRRRAGMTQRLYRKSRYTIIPF